MPRNISQSCGGPVDKRKTYIICQYGGIWRLSKTQLIRLFRFAKKNNTFNLDDFGKRIGDIDYTMPCDWEKEDFAEKLKELSYRHK